MEEMKGCILWDFDNTLAFRRGGMWRAALMEALDERVPDHQISADALRPGLRDGFPWHDWEKPHTELSSAELWWRPIESLLANALRGAGIEKSLSVKLAQYAHERYVDPTSFQLFPDTLPVLGELKRRGWVHAILSNHVPELPHIVGQLGLTGIVETVLSSARIGFEKPHPESFKIATNAVGNPDIIWMIGDNPLADVLGAEMNGIPAILVRRQDDRVKRMASDLYGVIKILG